MPPLCRALLAAAAPCLFGPCLFAQVRFDLRWNTHLDSMAGGFPLLVNDFAAGDVDGDGDPDLLVAMNGGGARIYYNDGDGVFSRFADLPSVGAGSRYAVLVDVDGDGDLDAFLAGGRTVYEGESESTLLRNDGAGHFTLSATIPTTRSMTMRLGVGDLDGDGDPDLVLFCSETLNQYSGHLRYSGSYWRNDGNGVFTDQTLTVFGGLPIGRRGDVVDIDNDGDLDVVNFTPTNVAYRNNGNGTFTAVGPTNVGHDWGDWVNRVTMADIDGDGDLDQIATDGAARPTLWRNVGGGVLQNATAAWFAPQADLTAGYTFCAHIVFDIDGDGDLDVITGGCEGRNTASTTVGIPPRVFVNSGRTSFVLANQPAFPWVQDQTTPRAAGDIDGDGDTDLLLGGGIWRQDVAGRFAPDGGVVVSHASTGPARWVDLDGDGDLDWFQGFGVGPIMPSLAGAHRVGLNDGTGTFAWTTMPATTNSLAEACDTGDVDGDGDIDIVVGSRSETWGGISGPGVRLILLANDGTGHFTDASSRMPARALDCYQLALRDFDGDGDLDVVAAIFASPSLVFFANDGTGQFTDETSGRIPANAYANGLSVLDLDGDGDLDLAQQGVQYINNGQGVFTSRPGGAWQLADVDGDGAADDLQAIVPQEYQTIHVIMPADVDQDGDLDLVVGCEYHMGNLDWQYYHRGILYNLKRDLRLASLPRLGQPYRTWLRATNGSAATFALVATSAGLLRQRVPVPGLGAGLLAIDPGQLLVLDVAIVPDADTRAEVAHAIPDDAALLGLPVATQALFVPVGHEWDAQFSNVAVETIVR